MKRRRYESRLKERARQLRKNMTDAERRLWSKIRRKQIQGVQFYRQRPIGPYIVDFYAPAARLVIEVDGGQHFRERGRVYDQQRDRYLRSLGLHVLRFTNEEVLRNLEGVVKAIWQAVVGKNPP